MMLLILGNPVNRDSTAQDSPETGNQDRRRPGRQVTRTGRAGQDGGGHGAAGGVRGDGRHRIPQHNICQAGRHAGVPGSWFK